MYAIDSLGYRNSQCRRLEKRVELRCNALNSRPWRQRTSADRLLEFNSRDRIKGQFKERLSVFEGEVVEVVGIQAVAEEDVQYLACHAPMPGGRGKCAPQSVGCLSEGLGKSLRAWGPERPKVEVSKVVAGSRDGALVAAPPNCRWTDCDPAARLRTIRSNSPGVIDTPNAQRLSASPAGGMTCL